MQWNDSANAGFTAGAPWLPVNPNYVQVNAAEALADPDSVLHHYRRLIELRHTEPAVADGDFTMLLAGSEQIYAFSRTLGDTELLVIGNLSAEPADCLELSGWDGAELLLSNLTHGETEPAAAGLGSKILQPWEARVLRRAR